MEKKDFIVFTNSLAIPWR